MTIKRVLKNNNLGQTHSIAFNKNINKNLVIYIFIDSMFGLEKYKDAFGTAGLRTGFRKYRILGVSIFDLAVVMVLCIFISWFIGYSYWITLAVILVLGVLVHRAFGVRTTVDKILFPRA